MSGMTIIQIYKVIQLGKLTENQINMSSTMKLKAALLVLGALILSFNAFSLEERNTDSPGTHAVGTARICGIW